MNEDVTAGIHPTARSIIDSEFNADEKFACNYFKREWYVTRAGKLILSKSNYEYILIKATKTYEETLGIAREVIVVFSDYPKFEPRTLDAYESVYNIFQDNRIERICYVIVSRDTNITTALQTTLSNQETQIVVPFSFDDLYAKSNDDHFLRNQFRKYFYSRDLFDYSDPLKKDFYFFGRNELVLEIIQKHTSGQNAGLFGLRKTGKTSIIYDIIRKLPQVNCFGVIIDCQLTSFNQRRWNNALYFVIKRICDTVNLSIPGLMEDQFTIENAAMHFERYISIIKEKTDKSILILFDEIENITFDKSAIKHWCDDFDFIFFWQSIRSVYQSTKDIFTFCIVGTNPRCIEVPSIKGKDNPIYNNFQPKYIEGFSVAQTREMVRKLGRLMGITFDEILYSKITEDFGGHPFLIRRIASLLAKKNKDRPIRIDRLRYNQAKEDFNKSSDYFDMLVDILCQFYPDEYEMMSLLATGDIDTFKYYASEDESYIKHLIGYGIITSNDENYDFKIDAIKEYLIRKTKKTKLSQSTDEKWQIICKSRNQLELELRKMVRITIRFIKKDEASAKNYIVKKIFAEKSKYSTYSYNDLFDSKKSEIYFKDLTNLINANWEYFTDYFGKQDIFISCMNIINIEGRFDAHASIPDDEEVAIILNAIEHIKKGIDNFQNI